MTVTPASATSDGSERDAGEPRLERGTALWRCRRPTGVRRRSAGDLAGLQAAGADVQPLGRTVDGGPHPLDVRVEATLRDLAGPGPVVAEARALGADVADGSHRELLDETVEVGS